MSLPFPSDDVGRLLRDPDAAVRTAAHLALQSALSVSDPESLCSMLWDLAATDAYELLPNVMSLAQHPTPRVRRFALIALKGLHPLCGLPTRSGVGSRPLPDGQSSFMNQWLAPRPFFRRALRDAIRAPGSNVNQLASTLAAHLPGEHALTAEAFQTLAPPDATNSYMTQRENAVGRRAPRQLIISLTYRCNRKCPYCYAYESQDTYSADLDFDAALRTLDWAKLQGAEQVSFTGGEPTCHPRFADLVQAVRARGILLYLNTNGLFSEEARHALSQGGVLNVGFHVSERKLHRTGELEQIAENLTALHAAGVPVFVRHTLWRSSRDDLPWLFDFCAQHEVRHLNLALGFPGKTATNRYLPNQALQEAKPLLLRALELGAARGVRVRTSKPIPLCLFTLQEFAHFQRFHELASSCTVHERAGVHNLVVNPDLSTYPCVGLPFAGPRIDLTDDYTPHESHCRTHLHRSLTLVQSSCHACDIYPTGVCQGSCLGHCAQPNSSLAKGRPVASGGLPS